MILYLRDKFSRFRELVELIYFIKDPANKFSGHRSRVLGNVCFNILQSSYADSVITIITCSTYRQTFF
jgi:hypothetical protein